MFGTILKLEHLLICTNQLKLKHALILTDYLVKYAHIHILFTLQHGLVKYCSSCHVISKIYATLKHVT